MYIFNKSLNKIKCFFFFKCFSGVGNNLSSFSFLYIIVKAWSSKIKKIKNAYRRLLKISRRCGYRQSKIKKKKLKKSFQVSCVRCHMSRDTCQVTCITCYVSPVTCHMSLTPTDPYPANSPMGLFSEY